MENLLVDLLLNWLVDSKLNARGQTALCFNWSFTRRMDMLDGHPSSVQTGSC